MQKSKILFTFFLLFLVACTTEVVDDHDAVPHSHLMRESAEILVYTIQGDPTGLAHVSFSFLEDRDNLIINVVGDFNQDDQLDPVEEWFIKNSKAKSEQLEVNNYAFELPTLLNDNDQIVLRVIASDQPISDALHTNNEVILVTATVRYVDVDDSIAISAPGAHPDLKRGGFLMSVSALEDGTYEPEGDIPDLGGGPMDCFPVATANNLISLANRNGIRDQIPSDPKDMIDEMKTDMKFDNGVLKENYLAGKQAFIDRYNLPITTEQIDRPSMEDLADALGSNCAVEISTTFLRSKSGKPDTGHVLTGAGISADGDDVQINVHDPATKGPQSNDIYDVSMTGGDNPFILIKNYPFWDGIMIVDAIYIQCWDDNLAIKLGYDLESIDEDPIGTVGQPFGEGKQTIDTLVIGGKHYPKTQFRIGSHALEGCEKDHWHADVQVFSVETPDQGINDPAPPNCGFGHVGVVPEETIELTEAQAIKWIGSILDN